MPRTSRESNLPGASALSGLLPIATAVLRMTFRSTFVRYINVAKHTCRYFLAKYKGLQRIPDQGMETNKPLPYLPTYLPMLFVFFFDFLFTDPILIKS